MSQDEGKRALYMKAIDACPQIEGKGKVISYTSVNGHMSSQFSKEGDVGIRLCKEDREAFLQKYDSHLLVSYGATMKEYVVVPDNLLNDTDTVSYYLHKAHEHVSSLKPKPSKK